MAYQHANRLTAHWLPKTQTATAKAVALYLAQNIQAEGYMAGRFYHSAEKLSAALGIGKKSADRALGALLVAGWFTYEVLPEHRSTGLRTYSLAIECPPDCESRQTHYTALELASRPTPEPVAVSHFDYSDTPAVSHFDYTYKELLNKEIDIDIKNSASFDLENSSQRHLVTITKALSRIKTKTANHLLLETCLKDHPELVSVDAERITKRATSNPDAYLAKTATETPESLLETFRASLETDTNPAATDWPESLVNELRLAALDLADNPAELQEQYNEYLLSSGSIPADLVDIAQARGMGYLSLEHLVADCRTIALGLEFYGLDPDTLAVGIGDFEKPVAGDFGSNQERYQEALELYQKRVEYRKAFESRQADLVEEWLKVHADPSLASALESEQVEALEAERIANPELSADPEHYSRLIHSELVDLPGVETLADYLNNPDTHESFIVPQLQAEFAEFWNAYPARPEGKGRKIAALRAWCEARKTTSQEALMSELRGAFLGVEPRLIPWPSSWLSNLTRPAQDAHLATGDQF